MIGGSQIDACENCSDRTSDRKKCTANLHGANRYGLCYTKSRAADRAGDVSSMPVAVIVGSSRYAEIKVELLCYEISSDRGTPLEFHMRCSDSTVNNIGSYARARRIEHVLRIQGK